MTTTTTSTSSTTTTDLSSQLAAAAQSIISGATNSTMDVNSLVQTLVAAKTVGQSTIITNKQTSDNTELSAVGQIKSALSSLDTALAGFLNGSALAQMQAAVTGTGVTATTSTGAVAGTYSVAVTNVATSSTARLNPIATGTTFNADTLSIQVGSGAATSVTIKAGASLTDVASAINKANAGVSAAVITATDASGNVNQYLTLTSTQTGSNTAISISDSGGANAALASVQSSTTGVDANVSINGIATTSASNTLTNVLTGVTLDISGAAANSTQTLTVSADTSASASAIQSFVTAYNNYVTTAGKLSSYDSSTSTAGPLLGDSMTNGITNGLASLISAGVKSGSTTYSLASIGLNLQPDGTLQVDSTALQTALTSNPTAVNAIFNSATGIGAKLDTFMSSYIQTSGIIDQRTQALNQDLSNLQDQATQLTNYSNELTAQYTAQFSALNTLMAQMQNNTNYLTQLFGGKNSAGSLATNK
ncbi:flagellar filament capping protein FliD [Paraburkholderia sp. CNPSo 3157]|uniref:Flagellar hook-associated protein 2 n=1 Tax=Paraburkholderia franconis TaxID=2654983 RepID=A0A7X1NB67_9BURK|nr:flagellar filament capping protein FliD [Paraburkholderia franconis]MPW18619.1 flagellar filament capping protein FliD [Paraburkholderia franconis]